MANTLKKILFMPKVLISVFIQQIMKMNLFH